MLVPNRPASSCQAWSYIDYNDSQIPKWSSNDHRVQCCNTLLVSKCLKNFNWAEHILYHCSNIWRGLVSHRRQRGCASTFFINCPDMSRKRYKHKHQQKLFKLSQSFFSSNLDPHKIGSQFLEAQQGRHFLPHPRSLEDDPTTGRSFPLPVAETSQPSPLPPFFWRDASPDAIYAWPLGKWEFFWKFLEFLMEELQDFQVLGMLPIN